MNTPENACDVFPLGTEVQIVAWHESTIETRAYGRMQRCVMTLRACDSGHGMYAAVEGQHAEFRTRRDEREQPLAVGLVGRWLRTSKRQGARKMFYFSRTAITP